MGMKISFKDKPISLKNGEQGASAIEYGLIAALIAVAAIAAMQGLSGNKHANSNLHSDTPAATAGK
jgi:pilus assembly protein Flp/PilA